MRPVHTKKQAAGTIFAKDFHLAHTLECGQCFRWRRDGDTFRGIIGHSVVTLGYDGTLLRAESSTGRQDETALRRYLGLDHPYEEILKSFPKDDIIRAAVAEFYGLRIMRQEPWETIASFILSINKRIDHIIQIVEKLSLRYGEPILAAPRLFYAFPSVAAIARCSIEELRGCGMGFRAPYISAVSRAIESGKLDLGELKKKETADAVESLQRFHGIGPKVANSIMLFGYGRFDAVPVDVWIGRAIEQYYFKGRKVPLSRIMKFTEDNFGPYRGYVQQYLYCYVRKHHGRISHHQ